MFAENFLQGDMVYAQRDLLSDGQIPGTLDGQLLVPTGTRGVVVRVGHLEAEPEVAVYMVCFEDGEGKLGEPLGCTTEELTQKA